MASKQILQQNSPNCDKIDLSPRFSCTEISPHDRFVSTFLHMTDLSLYLSSADISPTENHVWRNFSTSGYPSEYGDHGDSHETYNSGESNHCGDSDGFCGSDESD